MGKPIRIKLPCSVAVTCKTNLKQALIPEDDAHQKLKMKTHAESRRPIKDSHIQVGDTALVKQLRQGSSPHHTTQSDRQSQTRTTVCWHLKEATGRWLAILPTLRSLTKTMQIPYQLTQTQVQTQHQLTQTLVQTQYQLKLKYKCSSWTPTKEVCVCNLLGDWFKKCDYGHCWTLVIVFWLRTFKNIYD